MISRSMSRLLLLIFTGLMLSSCASRTGVPIKRSEGHQYMISSAHPLATQAGLEILNEGGNVIDAAIAVSYALAVVYPRAGNVAGGGFMLYRDSSGMVTSLDFRERAPSKAYRDMYLDDQGELIPGKSLQGPLAIAVPGTVDGLQSALEKYGSMEMRQLMKPAIKMARRGFTITQLEADRLNKYAPDLKRWNNLEDCPFIKDRSWKEGDLLRQPNLAKTLKGLSEFGKEHFYTGGLANEMCGFLDEHGGIITLDDLKEYSSKWRHPVTTNYKQFQIHSMPLPSSGGICLSQILESLDNFKLHHPHHVDDVHLIIEAERRSYADRASFLGDPDMVLVDVDGLLDTTYINGKMSDFDPAHATPSQSIVPKNYSIDIEGFETTHFTIADGKGNVVALTTTLNSNYGSKVFFPKGGFFFNNQMDDFSAKPGSPNQFGLVGTTANQIDPGKRMLSSMTPTIIEKNDDFYLALGSPGGSTIITSVVQVFLNVAEYDLTLEEAIALPRFHHQWLPDAVLCEETFSEEVLEGLRKKGHLDIRKKKYIGAIDAVMRTSNGQLIGGADPRGDDDTRGQ